MGGNDAFVTYIFIEHVTFHKDITVVALCASKTCIQVVNLY